jgi:hypothetical protein
MIMATEIKPKRKYLVEKQVGRYKGGHNDSTRRRPMKHKHKGKGPKITEHSTAYMIMLPSGKTKMINPNL